MDLAVLSKNSSE